MEVTCERRSNCCLSQLCLSHCGDPASGFLTGTESGVGEKQAMDAGMQALKVGAGVAGVAAGASTAGSLILGAAGFSPVGPAAGSSAAAWMSSIAVANGGGVAAGSLYSLLQSAAMGGSFFLGAPVVLIAGGIAAFVSLMAGL